MEEFELLNDHFLQFEELVDPRVQNKKSMDIDFSKMTELQFRSHFRYLFFKKRLRYKDVIFFYLLECFCPTLP